MATTEDITKLQTQIQDNLAMVFAELKTDLTKTFAELADTIDVNRRMAQDQMDDLRQRVITTPAPTPVRTSVHSDAARVRSLVKQITQAITSSPDSVYLVSNSNHWVWLAKFLNLLKGLRFCTSDYTVVHPEYDAECEVIFGAALETQWENILERFELAEAARNPSTDPGSSRFSRYLTIISAGFRTPNVKDVLDSSNLTDDFCLYKLLRRRDFQRFHKIPSPAIAAIDNIAGISLQNSAFKEFVESSIAQTRLVDLTPGFYFELYGTFKQQSKRQSNVELSRG